MVCARGRNADHLTAQGFRHSPIFGFRVDNDDIVSCCQGAIQHFPLRGKRFSTATYTEDKSVEVFQEELFKGREKFLWLGKQTGKKGRKMRPADGKQPFLGQGI